MQGEDKLGVSPRTQEETKSETLTGVNSESREQQQQQMLLEGLLSTTCYSKYNTHLNTFNPPSSPREVMPTVAQLIHNKAQDLNQDNLILGPTFLTTTLHCLSVRLVWGGRKAGGKGEWERVW